MDNISGKTVSVWMENVTLPSYPSLQQSLTTQVCVVGAGIAGISIAYELALKGFQVVVLEQLEKIASVNTARTTAHLSYVLDDRLHNLLKMHDEATTKLAWKSHAEAISNIESIVQRENIDCDFERLPGFLFTGDRPLEDLEEEWQAALQLEIPHIHRLHQMPVATLPEQETIRFDNQAQFDVLKYINGLCKVLEAKGVKIYTSTQVTKIEEGEVSQIKTSQGHTLQADHVVIATNTPVNPSSVMIHTKQAPYRTYAIGARIPKNSVYKALYWDMEDPYHYIRIHSEEAHDILIVGGEDHKTGQKKDLDECFENLKRWTKERFPMVEEVVYKWSGQVMEPIDGLAYIGKMKDNVYIVTGDSGHGITHAVIASRLISDLIAGIKNPYEEIYAPSRSITHNVKEYLKENLNVVWQFKDWLSSSEIDDISDLQPGTGAVIRKGLKKIAVYKNEQGEVFQMSAACTHLGCIVHWNDQEKLWDCPCHGSQFKPTGKVVNGPATEGLIPKE